MQHLTGCLMRRGWFSMVFPAFLEFEGDNRTSCYLNNSLINCFTALFRAVIVTVLVLTRTQKGKGR